MLITRDIQAQICTALAAIISTGALGYVFCDKGIHIPKIARVIFGGVLDSIITYLIIPKAIELIGSEGNRCHLTKQALCNWSSNLDNVGSLILAIASATSVGYFLLPNCHEPHNLLPLLMFSAEGAITISLYEACRFLQAPTKFKNLLERCANRCWNSLNNCAHGCWQGLRSCGHSCWEALSRCCKGAENVGTKEETGTLWRIAGSRPHDHQETYNGNALETQV